MPDPDPHEPRAAVLERACAALAVLVRQEYPEALTLVQIAESWGEGLSDEQIDALAVIDGQVPN